MTELGRSPSGDGLSALLGSLHPVLCTTAGGRVGLCSGPYRDLQSWAILGLSSGLGPQSRELSVPGLLEPGGFARLCLT